MEVVFYEDRRGRQPAKNYLLGVYRAGERSVIASFEHGHDLLEQFGVTVSMPNARLINAKEGLYELRFGAYRIAYLEHDGRIVLLHGWRKQAQKLDAGEEARALRNAADWRARFP